ncbi:Multiple organellar RNA editing factor 8 chloroplastic/mitochondrial [Bienertia sinuspersici]
MAAPRILSLSRTLFTTTTTNKQTLTSFLLSRNFFTASTIKLPSSLSLSTFSLLRLRPLSSLVSLSPASLSNPSFRTFSTRQSQNALSDNNPNWSNRPPKETILLDGCDFEHWLVVTEPPPENATRDEIIDSYIKTLAQIVGSEEEARMKIYSVSTKHYFAFGALVSEELSYKLKELPNVRWVLPDSYLDVKNKDYGGEPFINGEAVPYDPKYHEEWVRNNSKAQERNRRNDRPRNADRSRNFERRQQQPRNTNYQHPNPGGNVGGPGGNMGGPPPNRPPNNPGYGQKCPPITLVTDRICPPTILAMDRICPQQSWLWAEYAPQQSWIQQNMPPNNPGYAPNMPPNNAGYGQNMPPQSNPGFAPNMPPNNPNRGAVPPPNYGNQGNPGYGPPHQNTQMGNPNYPPQNNMGGQPGGAYQPQDVPGRDVPNYQ